MLSSRITAITVVLNTFFLCVVVYFLEYLYLYNKSVEIFGVAMFSKVFAFFAVFIAMYVLKMKWRSIGFTAKRTKVLSGLAMSLLIIVVSTVIACLVVYGLASMRGIECDIRLAINVSKLESAGTTSPGAISYVTWFISAFITAWMLETLFRSFMLQTLNRYLRFYAANTINIVCSIIWQLLIYILRVTFKDMTICVFLRSVVFCSIMYGFAAARRSLYVRAQGNIWPCFFDSFFVLLILQNLKVTISFPDNYVVSNPIDFLLSFMSTKSANATYGTIALFCIANIIAFIITAIYCHILKKKSRMHYLQVATEHTAKRDREIKNQEEHSDGSAETGLANE